MVFRHTDTLGVNAFGKPVLLVGGFQVQPFAEVFSISWLGVITLSK